MRKYKKIIIIVIVVLLWICQLSWGYQFQIREIEEEFSIYHDSFTEIAEIIYKDYLDDRKSKDEKKGYDLCEGYLASNEGEMLDLTDEQLQMLPMVIEGYSVMNHNDLDLITVGEGYVVFGDWRGNQMIYSVDGSRPNNSRVKDSNPSFVKLYEHWYRYYLVHI